MLVTIDKDGKCAQLKTKKTSFYLQCPQCLYYYIELLFFNFFFTNNDTRLYKIYKSKPKKQSLTFGKSGRLLARWKK